MKYPPIFKDVPHLIHGGDYNPDQWLDTPEILSEDIRLMKLAGHKQRHGCYFCMVGPRTARGRTSSRLARRNRR